MCSPGRPRVRVSSPGDVLAVVPHLLGFHPPDSLVVVGTGPVAAEGRRTRGGPPPGQPIPRGPGGPCAGGAQRIELAFRYDLPDPPDAATTAGIATHAAAVLEQRA